jgi:Mechanosensitive ion channel, conserved TM helix
MEYIQQFWQDYSPAILDFATALAFLLAFYIAAVILRSVIRRVMKKTSIDNKFVQVIGLKEDFPIESVVSGVIFWIVMIYGLLTFFDKLDLETVAHPINTFLTQIFSYLPKIGAALGLMVLAWVIASLVKLTITRVAVLFGVDRRLSDLEGEDSKESTVTVEESLANAGYWFIFLLFLPLVLGTLGMESLVAPLQDMFSKLFTYLPNLLSAAMIFFIGSFVARIVRNIVTNLLISTGVDDFGRGVGLQQGISKLVGTLVFTVILLLVIVQSLDALSIQAISGPSKQMITMIFLAVPGIVSSVLVLWVSYLIGKMLSGMVSDLLTAAGFDGLAKKAGLALTTSKTPSNYVGMLVQYGVILFAILGATELLGFAPLSEIVSSLINFAFQALLGAMIFGIGIMIARKVREMVRGAGLNTLAATLAYVSILALSGAMALRQIGLAEDIINMAFGIALGSIGIGMAIAIGLGSKDAIGDEVKGFIEKIKSS